MRTRSLVLAALLVASGCGAPGTDRPPTGADQLVLRVESHGGFVPPEFTLINLPELSLYGDGRVITPGPQIELYPGPALPNLQVTQISQAGISQIVAAAREAGLGGPPVFYGQPPIADAGMVTFTLVLGGDTYVTDVVALFEAQPGQFDEPVRRSRQQLLDLWANLTNLSGWLGGGAGSEQVPYEFEALAAIVTLFDPAVFPDQPSQEKRWPLGDLAVQPQLNRPELGCLVISGEELDRLLPEVQTSNELTVWRSGGQLYRVLFRPLLPDEADCSDL